MAVSEPMDELDSGWTVNVMDMSRAQAEQMAQYAIREHDLHAFTLDPQRWCTQVWDRVTVTTVLQALQYFVASNDPDARRMLTLVEELQEWLDNAEAAVDDT